MDAIVAHIPVISVTDFPIIRDAWVVVPVAVVAYLLLVFVGPKIMASREAFSLKTPLALWNLSLSVVSLIIFLSSTMPFVRYAASHGSDWLYHLVALPADYSEPVWHGPHMFWMWIFGLLKVGELIDTVFLVLRKRNVPFLHWYHHTTVLIFTWLYMNVAASPGFTFAIVNAFVHSVMYFYYFLTSIGYHPSWGKHVTQIQLSQMVVGVFVSVMWAFYYTIGRPCPLTVPAHLWVITTSVIMYGSYFYLFYQFYVNRFVKKDAKKEEKKQQ